LQEAGTYIKNHKSEAKGQRPGGSLAPTPVVRESQCQSVSVSVSQCQSVSVSVGVSVSQCIKKAALCDCA